jgi:protein-disulfide isomerase
MTDQPAAGRDPVTPEPGATPEAGPTSEISPADGAEGGSEPSPAVETEGGAEISPAVETGPTPEISAAVEAEGVPGFTPAVEAQSVPTPETPVGAPPRGRAGVLGYLGAAVLGIVIGAGGLAIGSGSLGAAPSPSPSPSPTATAAPADNAVGSPDAPVTMEVWADYQCPYCRLEDLLFSGALEREYAAPGIVRIVYRDFAFLGQESTDAAVAARCAGRQEAAARLRFHDALYAFQQGENQGRFVRENLLQVAQIVGVPDTTAFTACLDDPAVADEVAAETAAGRDLGISSTPTMRLRGPGGERVLTGFSQTWPTLRDAIEAVRVPAASPSPSGSPDGSAAPGSPAPTASPGSPAPTTSPAP